MKHRSWEYALLIVALSAVVLFTGLGATRFWDQDEGYFAGAAAEMYARGDWIVPHFNDEMFGHKPPWMYWMMMVGYATFGDGEFAARFFSAVFGMATALLTYQLGRRLFNDRVGFFAALAMISCVMFSVVARSATPDSYLVFFSTLALYLFAVGGFAGKADGETATKDPPPRLPKRWATYAGMYAVMGLAVLVKGPIGVVLPMAVIGMFLLCSTPRREVAPDAPRWMRIRESLRPFGPVNFVHTVWRMRPLTAVFIVLLVAGPWYLAVGLMTQGQFLWEFFAVHHFQRATSAMDNHCGSCLYYVPAVLVGMFPWSVFAAPAGMLWVRHQRAGGPHARAMLLVVCWAGVFIGLFSLASTKLPNYVLPAYPALALIVGYFLDTWIRRPGEVHQGWTRAALVVLLVVGLGAVVLLPAAAWLPVGGRTLLDRCMLASDVQCDAACLGLVGLPALFGGAAALALAMRGRVTAAVASVCCASVVVIVALWNFAAPRVDRFQTPQDIAQRIRHEDDWADCRVGQFGFFRPTMVYYAGRPIESCGSVEQAREFLAGEEPAYLITCDAMLEQLDAKMPTDVRIVDRKPRFPKQGEILLLSRQPSLTR